MKRRDFIKNTALLTAATGLPLSATAANMPNVGTQPAAPADSQPATRNSKLIDTPPALMNYAEDSMDITFGVSALANGFVTYGEKPDLSDGITVKCGGYRVTRIDDKVMQVRNNYDLEWTRGHETGEGVFNGDIGKGRLQDENPWHGSGREDIQLHHGGQEGKKPLCGDERHARKLEEL